MSEYAIRSALLTSSNASNKGNERNHLEENRRRHTGAKMQRRCYVLNVCIDWKVCTCISQEVLQVEAMRFDVQCCREMTYIVWIVLKIISTVDVVMD